MPTYAVHDGTRVHNVIIAETVDVAQDVTGLTAIETEGAPWIGWTLHGDEWRPPQPAEGLWVWDDVAKEWRQAVIPDPEA